MDTHDLRCGRDDGTGGSSLSESRREMVTGSRKRFL